MNAQKPTIAIYGIQDRNDFAYPGYTHDHSICVMEQGRITHYLQLERWSRRKYDNQLHLYIEDLMDKGHIPIEAGADLVFVNSFVGNSFLSRNGRIRFEQVPRAELTPNVVPGFAWVESGKWKSKELNAYGIDHELAHVGASLPFYGAFKDNSLLVHFDGGASLGNFSAYLYRNEQIKVLEYHWKLSPLSKFFNDNALTFAMLNHGPGEHCAVPGKLMGFATMGKPRLEIQEWLKKNNYFRDLWEDHAGFYEAARSAFNWQGRLGDTRDSFLQDVAASFQQMFEEEWIAYLTQLQRQFQTDYLYLSGGCALNIVANTRIIQSGLFQDIFIPPCPGDSGLSIGAAAFLEWKKHGQVSTHLPYLNNVGLPVSDGYHDQALVNQVAKWIAEGKIIGVFQGNGEAGPRALGNRSIIARPDSKALSQKVSMECKGREWYRPVAPIMLEKHAKRLTGLPSIHHLSRYMLLDFKIQERFQSEIGGVVHSNGTARIQTIFKRADNPFMFDLLSCLDERYGISALVNTSFNQKGNPIFHLPEEALAAGKSMSLDAVLINHTIHHLSSHALERHSPQ